MAKDVKIEVLYYKTATDVSLEFGLHGNYPLRLLSSGCNDINAFFHSLKRAVSRSEIIITVGGYNDGDYLPGFIARAIGRKCVIPNYRKAGIITENKHIIPQGAVPLAPDSRRFGGFLIECGPQTIISLTDDKKVRLDIVNQFLVNYITEHHNVFNRPFAVTAQRSDPSAADSDEIPKTAAKTEFSDITSSTVPNSPTAEAAEETTAAPEAPVTKHPPVKPPIAPVNVAAAAVAPVVEATAPEVPVRGPGTAEPDPQPGPDPAPKRPTPDRDDAAFDTEVRYMTRRKRRVVRIFCLVISLIILAALAVCIGLFPDTPTTATEHHEPEVFDYYTGLRNTYYSSDNDLSAGFDKLKTQNDTFYLWLTALQINVDHPVITVAESADTKQFLTSLPDQTADAAGTLFSTADSSPNLASKNTIIYGSAAPGGIFEELTHITTEPSRFIGSSVTTADSHFQSTWSVFSVFAHSSAQYFDYTQTKFSESDEYITYLEQLRALSVEPVDINFSSGEKLVILIGIADGERYCVAAKLASVRVLSTSVPVVNTPSSSVDSSSDITSSDSSSEITPSEPEEEDEPTDNEYYGETPDIILPPIDSTPSSSITTSSAPSDTSSANTSSDNTSSSPSGTTSSETVSSTPSQSGGTSSQPSSAVSSEASSAASSAASSSTPDSNVSPMYTWDITLHVIDNSTGISYSKSAVEIVAMIIEDEMSPTIDPKEAVVAQAIASYNWLLNNGATDSNKAPKVALDPNPTQQAIECANAAKGSIVMYGNTVAKTNYYAYSAGKTACTQDIWGGTAFPYLQSVDCPVDEELKDFITTKTYTADEIRSLIKSKCGIDVSGMAKTEWLKPIQYDANGLYCVTVSIGGKSYSGQFLRATLLSYGIRSTAYTVTYDEATDSFTVTCKGYGHGVGMSQRGAKAYARLGWTHEQILTHFFPGTSVVKY